MADQQERAAAPGVVGHEWKLQEEMAEVGITTYRCHWCGAVALREDLEELDAKGCDYFLGKGARNDH